MTTPTAKTDQLALDAATKIVEAFRLGMTPLTRLKAHAQVAIVDAISAALPANMTYPALPEPFGQLEQSGMWNGMPRTGIDPVYDADQMREYALGAVLANEQESAEPAQPVEAVDGNVSALYEEVRLALQYSRNHAEASPYLTLTGKEHILGLCTLVEKMHDALAHPRPTDDVAALLAEAKTKLARAVGTAETGPSKMWRQDVGSAAWDIKRAMDALAAPTVERAGQVVNDPYETGWADGYKQAETDGKLIALAQPRPLGVPDAVVKLAAIECARRAYGYWKGDSTGGDSAMRYFDGNMGLGGISHTIDMMESAIRKHIAAAPAPAKAGEV